jgi:A/G-specific adenine glycosylase
MTLPARNQKIQTKLLHWYKKEGRSLPWRKTHDAYAIWVSETMLQQTQVSTVIPYYRKFLKTFPTVRRLAKANLSEVLKVWEGLGYYSRARNLHRAAGVVADRFDGKIPDRSEELLTLPGIGRYTAGAVLSIAFNREAPILDGNVKRVLSRLFAIGEDIKNKKTEARLWHLSESLIPKGRAGSFNQAVMDLGATICTPQKPQCPLCPLKGLCKAKASGEPERFPMKKGKKEIPHVEAVSAVIERSGKVFLRQRPLTGLLGGLWEFPDWKIKDKEDLELKLIKDVKKELGIEIAVKKPIGTFRQTFSHFKLTLHVYHCQAQEREKPGKWVFIRQLTKFPMSRIHRKIADVVFSMGIP